MTMTEIIRHKFYSYQINLKKHIQAIVKNIFSKLLAIKSYFGQIYSFAFHFISIYSWYPSFISFLLTSILALSVIFVSKDIGINAIDKTTREIINNNLHTFLITLLVLIVSIVLYVGSSSGRDSSFDRSRVLFKTFMLFPLIIITIINSLFSVFIHPENLLISYSFLLTLILISMIKLFDSILNRQQFEEQRKLIAISSMRILHSFLSVPQKIIASELSAFASECHMHLASNNITFAKSSIDSLRDLIINLRVVIKNNTHNTRRYNTAVSLYKNSIELCNQILLSSTEDSKIEVFKIASYPIKSSVNLVSTKDVKLSVDILRNISHHGFVLYGNKRLRKYFWEALIVVDKHSYLDTVFIEVIEKCNNHNYDDSIILVEFILSEVSTCIRYCIEAEDTNNFQMIKNTLAYITQNGPSYPQSLSICAKKLREESRTLGKQHALGILAWTLSKEKPNYETYLYEFLAMIPKKISALWSIFEKIVLREDEEKFIWTSTGVWMEGSGSWCGNLYEGGFFKAIIILIFFIDPVVSEKNFYFPKAILYDLLKITNELERNYPSKIFNNDQVKTLEFQAFLVRFRSIIESQNTTQV